jgi:DAACS family dicarboxylate/amino acid:cation (Na+ or H+) symporter
MADGPVSSAEPSPRERSLRRSPRFPFVARILAAIAVGIIAGLAAGSRAEPLGTFGSVVIGLIKALAGPLLFFAVADAFIRTRVRTRSAALMVGISLTNAAIAIVVGMSLSNGLRPGRYGDPRALLASPAAGPARVGAVAGALKPKPIDFLQEVAAYVPTSVVRPFLDNSIIALVFLAVLFGASVRHVKNRQVAHGEQGYVAIENLVGALFQTIETMLAAVITLIPLAIFGAVASTVGRSGFAPFRGLAAYVGVAVLGLAIQVLVVYQSWIIFVARKPLRWFWAGARDALAYALGASSSLATLPVTLRCLDRMKVSPQSARMAACVGTNLNNDGILLYEAMAVLFVAQVHGIELTVGQQLLAAASCTIAGIGIAAVPEAGYISLALVLGTVGLPTEILPVLLTVDWLLSRCRAMTNVTSDILVAVLLDRFDPDHRALGGDEPAGALGGLDSPARLA